MKYEAMLLEPITSLIQRRDSLSYEDAYNAVHEVADQITYLTAIGASIEEIEDELRMELGLEPDYLEYFL